MSVAVTPEVASDETYTVQLSNRKGRLLSSLFVNIKPEGTNTRLTAGETHHSPVPPPVLPSREVGSEDIELQEISVTDGAKNAPSVLAL